jgi:hypothetical protein
LTGLLNFNCPFCNQGLDVPEKYAGQDALCPACQKVVVIPALEIGPGEEHIQASDSSDGLNVPPSPDEADVKSSTIRIDVGEEMVLPKAKPRVIKIKRSPPS